MSAPALASGSYPPPAARLREIRQAYGVRVKRMAAALAVSESVVCDWEAGRRRIPTRIPQEWQRVCERYAGITRAGRGRYRLNRLTPLNSCRVCAILGQDESFPEQTLLTLRRARLPPPCRSWSEAQGNPPPGGRHHPNGDVRHLGSLGQSVQRVNDWEMGRRPIPPRVAQEWARILEEKLASVRILERKLAQPPERTQPQRESWERNEPATHTSPQPVAGDDGVPATSEPPSSLEVWIPRAGRERGGWEPPPDDPARRRK